MVWYDKDMVIGIDASRAFVSERTGTENYSYELITHMLRLTAAKKHTFVLFIRPNAKIPIELDGYSNVIIKVINFPILWTQVGLALATWGSKLDVLWIPAHTLPVLRKSKLKTVVTIHGLEYKYLPQYNNWLQRWYLPLSTYYAARRADRLICVSESTKRELIAETGIDAEKTTVIYEGANFGKSATRQVDKSDDQFYQRYGIERGKYILFVGTVQPRKNVRSLITAFTKITATCHDYKLVIAGKVGWDAEFELQLPLQLGIAESVVFTGRVSPELLRALYQGAAIYVQPSWTEGFGLPVLEAMSYGVPVIASDGGALPEVVGDAGIVIPLVQKNREFAVILGETLSKLLSDASRLAELGRKGPQRVRKMLWSVAAKQTFDCLITGL